MLIGAGIMSVTLAALYEAMKIFLFWSLKM